MASIAERLAAAKLRAEAVEARVSDPAFAAEEQARKELAEYEERERAAAERLRSARVAQRLDFWADKIGDGARAVLIAEKPHDFIVAAAGAAAYRAWNDGVSDAAVGKMMKGQRQKVDRDDVSLRYVVAGVLEWNGTPLDARSGQDVDTVKGKALNDFLRAEPAIMKEIEAAVLRLDGAASDERKS